MTSNRLLDVAVEVHVDDAWHEGWLDPTDWRKRAGRWVATIRWTKRAGRFPETYIDTFDEDRIRKV